MTIGARSTSKGGWHHTEEAKEKIGAAHRGVPGHPQSAETRAKIGTGARQTRLREKRACPYSCGVVTNAGALARHVQAEHEFKCRYPRCAEPRHKGNGYCGKHWILDRSLRAIGSSIEEYLVLWKHQGGRCAVCRRRGTKSGSGPRPGQLVMDHCHTRSTARGLLCHGCNLALGHMKDDPVRLRAAADYLEGHV
jgi:hypothetical protein